MNIERELKRLKFRLNDFGERLSLISIGSMRLETPDQQDFDDVDYAIVVFDEVVEARGGLKVHVDDNSITIDKNGLYSVEIGFCAGFNGQEELNLMTLVNGVPYSSNAAAVQGRSNNKPVSLFWKSTTRLKRGDKIQLGAMNGDPGTVTAHINRLHFEIRRIG
jgi:FtsP/CotA-like multicopper oxidase with cupredoxin domain